MRIAMLCRSYEPYVGGVEKHVKKLAEQIVSGNGRVDIFTLRYEGPNKIWSTDKEGIYVHRKPNQLHSHILKFVLAFIPFFPKNTAQKIVERDEIWGWLLWNLPKFLLADVIHIHDVFFWYWPIRLLLPWKKVYITFHGFEAGSLPTEKAKIARQRADKWTRGNIAVGTWIEKWYGTKADFITYGAADCLSVKVTAETSDDTRCVFIGRVAKDTGTNVYAKVIADMPQCKLDVFGEGSKQGSIADSCATFPEYDLACVSSYLSIVEAMQSKVLVLAYASDSLKWDYLQSHPMSNNMIIVRNSDEMKSFLRGFKKEKYKSQVDLAYKWAKRQTWQSVYLIYKELWQR